MLTFEANYGGKPKLCQHEGLKKWQDRREVWYKAQTAMRERILDVLNSREWETSHGSAVIRGLLEQIQQMEPA